MKATSLFSLLSLSSVAVIFTATVSVLIWRQSSLFEQNEAIAAKIDRLASDCNDAEFIPREAQQEKTGVANLRFGMEEEIAARIWKRIDALLAKKDQALENDDAPPEEHQRQVPSEHLLILDDAALYVGQVLDDGKLSVENVLELRRLTEDLGQESRSKLNRLVRRITNAINDGRLDVEDPAFIVF